MTELTREPPASGSIPVAPLLIGLAGLVPFWGLALALFAPRLVPWGHAASAIALVIYAALIISFLGGIRWGLAVAAPAQAEVRAHYAVAVAPSLAAWALLGLPEPWRLVALGMLALGLGPVDRGLVASGLAPAWFGRLRIILSCGAGAALLVAAFAARQA